MLSSEKRVKLIVKLLRLTFDGDHKWAVADRNIVSDKIAEIMSDIFEAASDDLRFRILRARLWDDAYLVGAVPRRIKPVIVLEVLACESDRVLDLITELMHVPILANLYEAARISADDSCEAEAEAERRVAAFLERA